MGKQQNIRYTIGLDVDESSTERVIGSFQKIQKSLNDIRGLKAEDLIKGNPKLNVDQAKAELKNLQTMANKVEAALNKSYNPKLNTYNIVKFNQELKAMDLDLKTIGGAFSQLGAVGESAFVQIASAATQTQQIAKQSTGVFRDMLDTFAKTAKWSIASGLVNSFKGLIQETWSYTKKLDASLNDIRIVTGQSALEMQKFSTQANKAAQRLAASTTEYTNASLIYYQQGLSNTEVEK